MTEQEYIAEAVFSIKLHLVLVTKNRQNILNGDIKVKLRNTVRAICDEYSVQILEGAISSDHLQIKISISPKLNINKFILLLKGKTTYELFMAFDALRQQYLNRHLGQRAVIAAAWARLPRRTLGIT
jgi:putative transposase